MKYTAKGIKYASNILVKLKAIQIQIVCLIGGATAKFLGGPNPSLHLSPSFPFTFSFPLPFPSIPLEVGPLNRGRGMGRYLIWRHQFY